MKCKVLLVGFSLSLIFVMMGAAACVSKENKQKTSQESTDYVERKEAELTVEEANELVANEQSDSTSVEEMFQPYKLANQLLLDSTAPHNLSGESLMEFAKHFSRDVEFQKSRTHLDKDTPYSPDYEQGILDIQLPDSTFFFASWSEIDDNEASFCNGWLGSEMNNEYVFKRSDDGKWYLIEYFSAIKERC